MSRWRFTVNMISHVAAINTAAATTEIIEGTCCISSNHRATGSTASADTAANNDRK
jgi:hypothetical protein